MSYDHAVIRQSVRGPQRCLPSPIRIRFCFALLQMSMNFVLSFPGLSIGIRLGEGTPTSARRSKKRPRRDTFGNWPALPGGSGNRGGGCPCGHSCRTAGKCHQNTGGLGLLSIEGESHQRGSFGGGVGDGGRNQLFLFNLHWPQADQFFGPQRSLTSVTFSDRPCKELLIFHGLASVSAALNFNTEIRFLGFVKRSQRISFHSAAFRISLSD